MKFDSLDDYKSSAFTGKSRDLVALVFFFGILAMLFVPVFGTTGVGFPLVSIALLTAVIALSIFVKFRAIERHNENVLRAFAADNGLLYLPASKEIEEDVGTLFGVGHSKYKNNIFSGTLENLPFSSYEYYYTTGGGKHRKTHDAMVVEVTLPRILPQFVIDSEIEDVIPIQFDKSQKIELEGDFHKYFDLYAPDKYGMTALTLLAPDAMEVLMEHAALCDIEVVNNKLFFYWPVPARSKQQFEQLFTTAQAVITKLGVKLAKSDIYATDSQAQIHAVPNGEGVKLKKPLLGWPVLIAIFAMWPIAFVTGMAEYLYFLIWIIVGGYALYMYTKRTRLKREYIRRYQLPK